MYPSPAAEAESDGSTVVYFSPTQPDDVAPGNWIQTDPEKGWFVILRSTARSSPSSTRPGDPARSNPSADTRWSATSVRIRRPRRRKCCRRSQAQEIDDPSQDEVAFNHRGAPDRALASRERDRGLETVDGSSVFSDAQEAQARRRALVAGCFDRFRP